MHPGEQQQRGLLYTPREIAQQPYTWQATLALFLQHRGTITAFLEAAGLRHPPAERPTVLLIGAGTSDYIGHALAPLLRQSWGCEVFACPSTELLLNLEQHCLPGRRYIFVSFSRSGDSPEALAVLARALAEYPAIAHLVITCNAAASIIRLSQSAALSCALVLDDAANDRGLAMTSSFTNMVVLGHCLAHAWFPEPYLATHARMVAAAHSLLQTAADAADRIAHSIAARPLPRACFLGSGPLLSVARESALKVLELTAGQVKTMAETVLGLRHGPMAALDPETLLVCFASGTTWKALYARDLLTELGAKAITAQRIVLGPSLDPAGLSHCADIFLPIEGDVPDLYRPALDVLFGQLLGLYLSVAHGLTPDAPSPAGVISRVVPPFQIHPASQPTG